MDKNWPFLRENKLKQLVYIVNRKYVTFLGKEIQAYGY